MFYENLSGFGNKVKVGDMVHLDNKIDEIGKKKTQIIIKA